MEDLEATKLGSRDRLGQSPSLLAHVLKLAIEGHNIVTLPSLDNVINCRVHRRERVSLLGNWKLTRS